MNENDRTGMGVGIGEGYAGARAPALPLPRAHACGAPRAASPASQVRHPASGILRVALSDSHTHSRVSILAHVPAAALAAIALSVAIPARADLSAQDVMKKNEDARKVDDVTSSATLATGGGGSTERVKEFTWWRKLMDGKHFDTLTRFHAPAEVRGEGILFIEHEGDRNDVMMYLPAFKKIRRVESQAQSGSFMGSDLSYSDIATPHIEDYKYALARQEACPGDASVKCYVIESTPVNEDVQERTGYTKTTQWVRSDNFMAAQGEYYDADGKLWKRMQATEIKEVDPSKHKWMAHHLRVDNLRNGHFTTLQFKDVKVNAGIQDSVFTTTNLSREK